MTQQFAVPPNSAEDAAEAEQLVQRYRERFGTDAITTVHPHDEMFNIIHAWSTTKSLAGTLKTYLESGEALVNDVDRIFTEVGYSWEQVGRFLDFACGYGRGTRFLAHKLGPERVACAEITPAMVEFVTRTFGVDGFVSDGDPNRIHHTGKYDAIYSVSLFSHLPHRTFGDFLGKLYGSLNRGGY